MSRSNALRVLIPALLALFSVGAASAVPTPITVRVIAKGAKFVGSSMGGARVVIADADSGEVLAQGVTAGSTGDTRRIMREAHGRDGVLSSEGAARFDATLDLVGPRRLRITAFGPLAQRQAMGEASVTQWALPGKALTGGDGVLLELPGFVVDVLAPPTHARVGTAPTRVPLHVNVTMMCGCPVSPGGLWDADRYEVRAQVARDGLALGEVPLSYAGSDSQFAGTVDAAEPGIYTVTVYAYDPTDGNTGVDTTTFLVAAP